MQYQKDELEKVQKVALTILKEVARICDEEKISYFIIGGTALGAVRHGGFIPWDDDIDIGMVRKDYEKFLKISPEKLGNKYFLQHFCTESATPFYFAKVRMNNTRFVEDYCKDLPIHHGIFLDIFPYDNIPDDQGLREKHRKKVKFYSELFISKSVKDVFTSAKGFSRTMKLIVRRTLHLLLSGISKQFLFRILDKASTEFNDVECQYVNYVKYPFLKIRKDSVSSLDKIVFEDTQFSCCKNLDEYLGDHFGNYMKLPDPEKRVNHRPVIVEFT
jgi:lipopolysaccharide cholinephosphotransferase